MKIVKTIKLMRVPYDRLDDGDSFIFASLDGPVTLVKGDGNRGMPPHALVPAVDEDKYPSEVRYSIEDLDGADDGGTTWVSIHDRLFEQVARGKSMIHYGVDTTTVETRYV